MKIVYKVEIEFTDASAIGITEMSDGDLSNALKEVIDGALSTSVVGTVVTIEKKST